MQHKETTRILSAWINSCIHEEQLTTCREAISEFFIKRFLGEIHEADYDHDLNSLYSTLNKRRLIISLQPKVTAMSATDEDNRDDQEVFKLREREYEETKINEHFDTAHDIN